MSLFVTNPDEVKEYIPRFRVFYVIIGLTLILFTSRLWYLQIIQGTELRDFSEKNRIKQIKIQAPRGIIYDRDGKILVENHPGFEAVLTPQYVPNFSEVAKKVAPLIKTEVSKLLVKIEKSRKQNGPFTPIKLKENLSKDEVFRLKRIRLETPGLDIRENVLRYYPLMENASQLFGYVGEISKKQIPLYNQLYKNEYKFEQGDIIGKNGLEELLERDIRGNDGIQFLQVDAFGREAVTQTPNIYGEEIKDKEPVPGNNVILTIDKDLQEVAWKTFAVEGKRIGGVVALKTNGEVLSWISTPSFDPNEFSQGITMQTWSRLINDPFKPLRNKVIQDLFSPGSTFKAFMAVTALEEKIVQPSTVIYCPGLIRFGKRDYHDHLKQGHGNVTIYDALERSSNVFFYKMGIALGIEKMFNYISLFGIGSKTGIELPRESPGLMPSQAWKKASLGEDWQPGENLSNAIGQGFVQVTPLQLAIGYNAIGLEGKVVKPFIIKKVVNNEGKVLKEFQSTILRDLTQKQATGVSISPETFKVVKEGLRRVVNGNRGTARSLRIAGVEIAGKTGTTQVMGFAATDIYNKCENRPLTQRHHGWFVGYAPAENPEIIVAALAEHSCHGGSGAGPVVKEIIKAYFQKYHPGLLEAASKEKTKPLPTIEPEPQIEGE